MIYHQRPDNIKVPKKRNIILSICFTFSCDNALFLILNDLELLIATYALYCSSDPIVNKNNQERSTVQEVTENAILQKSAFDVRNILPNVAPDLTSLRMMTDYACPVGEVVIGSSCGELIYLFYCCKYKYFSETSNTIVLFYCIF